MPTHIGPLTLPEFEARYAGEKPYFEYKRGEATQKSMPTWMHSLLQRLMVELLEQAGYSSGQEIELRAVDHWHPVPDVIAVSFMEEPYPTRPVDVVVEVLSPEDRIGDTLEKCADYEAIGVKSIFALDPMRRQGWQWERGKLVAVTTLNLPNLKQLELATVWSELHKRLEKNKRQD